MSAEQKIEDDAFLAGLASVTGNSTTPAPVAEVEEAPEPAAEKVEQAEPVESEAPVEAEKPESDLPRIAGFTEDELRNLLSRAAKVDELEAGLRKAHGKIGELNGSLQAFKTKPPAEKQPETMDMSHIEEDYPDIAAWVRAQLDQRLPVAQQPEQPEQAQQPAQVDYSPDLQLALMDHLHEGWREKVQTRDFNLWLASQGDDVRNKYETAATAKELSGVIGQFDAWSTGKETRNTQSKQRLEQALTPSGGAGKPKSAPTPDDAFIAGLRSVIAR